MDVGGSQRRRRQIRKEPLVRDIADDRTIQSWLSEDRGIHHPRLLAVVFLDFDAVETAWRASGISKPTPCVARFFRAQTEEAPTNLTQSRTHGLLICWLLHRIMEKSPDEFNQKDRNLGEIRTVSVLARVIRQFPLYERFRRDLMPLVASLENHLKFSTA